LRRGVEIVGRRMHPVTGGEFFQAFGAGIGGDDLGWREHLLGEQPLNHGFAHDPAADEGNRLIGEHGFPRCVPGVR